jgi:hypothetical protein
MNQKSISSPTPQTQARADEMRKQQTWENEAQAYIKGTFTPAIVEKLLDIDVIVAMSFFAEKMSAQAQKEAREAEMERSCKDVCAYCRHTEPTRTEGGGSFTWTHPRGSDCLAAAIRERWAGKREG